MISIFPLLILKTDPVSIPYMLEHLEEQTSITYFITPFIKYIPTLYVIEISEEVCNKHNNAFIEEFQSVSF